MAWNTRPAENPPTPLGAEGRQGRQGGLPHIVSSWDMWAGNATPAPTPLCLTALCGPTTYAAPDRVYQYLAQEMFYQYRSAAEEVVKQVNQRLADILQGEELRPFDEYSFLKVTANPLFKNSAIIASPSPSCRRKRRTGVIGYFQINPDGSLNSPVLPDLDEAELSANAERFGFGSSELARRLALRSRIEALLRAGAPTTDRRKRQQHAAQSSAAPAPMASAPAAVTWSKRFRSAPG